MNETTMTIEVGKTYRLLPDARLSSGVLSSINDTECTRVRVVCGPDSEGDVNVEALDGLAPGNRGFWVTAEYLAADEGAEPVAIEVGKTYRLLPGAKTAMGGGVYFDERVTQVTVKSGPYRGDYCVQAVDAFDGTEEQWVDPKYLAPLEVETTEPTPETTDSDAAKVIADLEEQVRQERSLAETRLRMVNDLDARVTQLINERDEARRRHREDIALIGSVLLEEAGSRDWCDDYDDVVEGLNRKLYVELPVRERRYLVTVEVFVTGTDEDDAQEKVESMLRNDDDVEEYNVGRIRTA